MDEIYSIGIDIGGTKVIGAIVSEGIIIGDIIKIATADNAQEIKNNVFKIIDTLSTGTSVQSIGIATAGVVNVTTGEIVSATENLSNDYAKTNFKTLIENKYHLKTFVDNDANAAAFGEYKFGAAKNTKNAIMLTFGTGIGGGIIINNSLYRGTCFAAGEFGHIPVMTDYNLSCTCGKTNCWEACASGTGLVQYVKHHYKNSNTLNCDLSEITTYRIFQEIKANNPSYIEIYENWHILISQGIIAVMNSLAPDCIVIGGGLSEFINFNKLEELTTGKSPSKVLIKKAILGNFAGIIGVASLAEEMK